ncbi:FecR family protein [Filimonas effusa]|uniref:FecR family protein n=1 Tax=Filimonas effusa TaxID=2508721 RepID=A0A4Q1D8U8_9BACT|nr:FecR family protein [Filimonas effusa]RXK85772.1 FecR family protein [Filimonas effusa]
MESRRQYDELLTRFLANGLTREEEETVQHWLSGDPENQRYFHEFMQTWRLTGAKNTIDYVLNEMDTSDKWKQFKETVIEEKQLPDTTEVLFHPVYEESEAFSETPVRQLRWRKGLVRVAAAAAIVFAIVVIGRLLVNEERPVRVVQQRVKATTAPVIQTLSNTSGKEKEITLPDGSVVILSDKSELNYREPFLERREVVLSGRAHFNITKDSRRPFKVISGDVATTVLGTEFLVTAFEKSDKIFVRLYTGKVVVNAVEKNNKWMKKGAYLAPGQEFIYSYTKGARVRSFRKVAPVVKSDDSIDIVPDNPMIPKNAKVPWFMFNNQLLGEVLDQLAGIYGVQIMYDEKDVRNKYFVGKFNKTDSLDIILKYITEVNGLRFTRTNDAYHIEKQSRMQ